MMSASKRKLDRGVAAAGPGDDAELGEEARADPSRA